MRPRPADQTGILMQDGRRLILSQPGGAFWRLQPTCRIDRDLLGRRVRVIGQRVEFNTIEADLTAAA